MTNVSAAVRRTLVVVLALNALVTLIKLVVGFHTHAVTVVGAGLESGLDLMNNIIALTIIRIAHRGPDEEHPYGHAKFETLGTLAVVGFLSISCFELVRQGVRALTASESPHATRMCRSSATRTWAARVRSAWSRCAGRGRSPPRFARMKACPCSNG